MGLQIRKTKDGRPRYWFGEYRWHDDRGLPRRKTKHFGPLKLIPRDVAVKIEAVWRGNLIQQRFLPAPPKPPPTLQQFAQEFLENLPGDYRPSSVKRLQCSLRVLLPSLGQLRLDTISELDVRRYVRERLSQGRQAATINNELRWLGHLLRTAVDWERTPPYKRSPVKLLHDEAERIRVLSAEEEARLLQACHPSLACPVRFALATGLRVDEIRQLAWSWIDGTAGTLTLPSRSVKSRRTDTIPLNEAALSVLRDLMPTGRADPSARVFLTRDRVPWGGPSADRLRLRPNGPG